MNTMQNTAELFDLFARTVAEVTEREFPNLTDQSVIAQLGVDSLAIMEVIGTIERELKIRLPDEELAGIATVSDLIELVQKKQGN